MQRFPGPAPCPSELLTISMHFYSFLKAERLKTELSQLRLPRFRHAVSGFGIQAHGEVVREEALCFDRLMRQRRGQQGALRDLFRRCFKAKVIAKTSIRRPSAKL